ncbi:hypothetical protein ABK040_003445 [Willaertia magna]
MLRKNSASKRKENPGDEAVDVNQKLQKLEEEIILKTHQNLIEAKEGKCLINETVPSFSIPPVKTTNEPPPSSYDGTLMCKVTLKVNNSSYKKTVNCMAEMSADDFTEFFINKINSSYLLDKKKEDWVFKAEGKEEYLYGESKMISFHYIRECVNNSKRVELELIEKVNVGKDYLTDDKLSATQEIKNKEEAALQNQ